MSATPRLSAFRPQTDLGNRTTDLESLPSRRPPSSEMDVFGRVVSAHRNRSQILADAGSGLDQWHSPSLGQLLLAGGITLKEAEKLIRHGSTGQKSAATPYRSRQIERSTMSEVRFFQPSCTALSGTLITIVVMFACCMLT